MLRNRKFVWRKFGPSRARWNKNALVMESWVSTTCVLNSVSCVKTSYSSTSQSQSVWTCVQYKLFQIFPFLLCKQPVSCGDAKITIVLLALITAMIAVMLSLGASLVDSFGILKRTSQQENFTKLRCKQNESIMELCPILSQAKAIPTSILLYV